MNEEIKMANVTEIQANLKKFKELWDKLADSEHTGQAYSYELSSIAKTLVDMNLSEEFKNSFLSDEEKDLLNKVVVISKLK